MKKNPRFEGGGGGGGRTQRERKSWKISSFYPNKLTRWDRDVCFERQRAEPRHERRKKQNGANREKTPFSRGVPTLPCGLAFFAFSSFLSPLDVNEWVPTMFVRFHMLLIFDHHGLAGSFYFCLEPHSYLRHALLVFFPDPEEFFQELFRARLPHER